MNVILTTMIFGPPRRTWKRSKKEREKDNGQKAGVRFRTRDVLKQEEFPSRYPKLEAME